MPVARRVPTIRVLAAALILAAMVAAAGLWAGRAAADEPAAGPIAYFWVYADTPTQVGVYHSVDARYESFAASPWLPAGVSFSPGPDGTYSGSFWVPSVVSDERGRCLAFDGWTLTQEPGVWSYGTAVYLWQVSFESLDITQFTAHYRSC